MPRRLLLDPGLPALLHEQDHLVTTTQAASMGLTRGAVAHYVSSGAWQRLLPGVLLVSSSEPTRRQLVLAARLWGGDDVLVDGPSALWREGIRTAAFDPWRVDLVVPRTGTARSRDFVVVRQSQRRPDSRRSPDGPYVDLAVAAVVTAARMRRRDAAALLHELVQRERMKVDDLVAAMQVAPPRGCRQVWDILGDLGAGTRSAPEADVRQLVLTSLTLPEPLWNPLLRLPDGKVVSPDALWVDAGLVHEVNGKKYHAWAEMFDDMQVRHDLMVVAGLTLLHNTPTRICRHPGAVLGQIEACYRRDKGKGLPPGITVLSEGPTSSSLTPSLAG